MESAAPYAFPVSRLLLALLLVACGSGADDAPVDAGVTPDAPRPVDAAVADAAPGDLADRLRAIPGMTVVEEAPAGGARVFSLSYEQPERHAAPDGAHFRQRMRLLHVGEDAPMVLHATGYALGGVRADEVTAVVGGNQLSLEHRFFGSSLADPASWDALRVAEAAADWHRVVVALRPIYRGPWIGTGASKGGVASLFHRRFYPDDVTATVAFVAPLSVGAPDPRYPSFVAAMGGDEAAGCRARLRDFQRLVLSRRTAMTTAMMASGQAFTVLGLDKALEDATLELPFLFWQYTGAGLCSSIPDATASDQDVYLFFDDATILALFGDGQIRELAAFYHQAAVELGWPAHDESHLADLLLYPSGDRAGAYVPWLSTAYDGGAAVRDLAAWIAAHGSRLLLVYGERDPWTAGAVDLGAATDSFRFLAPGKNHGGATLANLAAADRAAAEAALRRWAGR